MFKKGKSAPSLKVNVTEGAKFIDFVKVLLLTVVVAFLAVQYIQKQTNGTNSTSGVVFKNLSNDYKNIETSYDSVLINKDKAEINETEGEGVLEDTTGKHNVFFVEYKGTLMAQEVHYLKQKIDAIILKANEEDEVLISITSPGGAVSGYGLVASQINRLKVAGLKVTAVVDTVAASGGYMAAVVADEIVAAPFAMVGSIGVVANVMIYEDLLKNLGVSSRVYTAGESKRTVVPTRTPTPEEEAKLEEQLEDIHNRFKDHVLGYRPDVAIDEVFTGEAFLAVDAMKYGLVDKMGTSDELLVNLYKDGHRLVKVEFKINEDFSTKMTKNVSTALLETIKSEVFNNNVTFF